MVTYSKSLNKNPVMLCRFPLRCSGFRGQGLGFGFCRFRGFRRLGQGLLKNVNLEFRDQGSGLRVQGLEFRV